MGLYNFIELAQNNLKTFQTRWPLDKDFAQETHYVVATELL